MNKYKKVEELEFKNYIKNLKELNPLDSDSDGVWHSNKTYFNNSENITVAYSESLDMSGFKQSYFIR